MANHNETGKLGEAIAISYLEDKRFRVLDRNWRFGKAEVDIVAISDNLLIFVEVKTRTNNTFGYPEDSINRKKERLLMDAAGAYMREINYQGRIRFDVISIILEPKMEIIHFEDAFFPGWDRR